MAKSNIIISAKDEASAKLEKLESNIKKLETTNKSVMGQMKNQFANFFSAGALLSLAQTGIASLQTFLTDSFKLWAEDEKSVSLLKGQINALGESAQVSAGYLVGLAAKFQNEFGIADDEILKASSSLLKMENISGSMYERILMVGADSASAFGGVENAVATLALALEEPEKGMKKLRSAGIVLNESLQNQIKLLVEQGKVGEAQNIILLEMENRFKGVSAEIDNTALGAMTRLQNSWEDYQKNFGEIMGELFKPITQSLTESLNEDNAFLTLDPMLDTFQAKFELLKKDIEGGTPLDLIVAKNSGALLELKTYLEENGVLVEDLGSLIETALPKYTGTLGEFWRFKVENAQKLIPLLERIAQQERVITLNEENNATAERERLRLIEERNRRNDEAYSKRQVELNSLSSSYNKLTEIQKVEKDLLKIRRIQNTWLNEQDKIIAQITEKLIDSNLNEAYRNMFVEATPLSDLQTSIEEYIVETEKLANTEAEFWRLREMNSSNPEFLQILDEVGKKYKFISDETEKAKQDSEEFFQTLEKNLSGGLDTFKTITNPIFETYNLWNELENQRHKIHIDNLNKELDELKGVFDNEKELRISNGTYSTQWEIDQKNKILEKEQEVKREEATMKKKAFEDEKKAKIGATLMSGAEGAVKALTHLPFPANLGLVALYAGLTSANVAMIASQPVPEFYSGGIISGSDKGTVVRVGEKNQTEIISPISSFYNALEGKGKKNITLNIGNIIGTPTREVAIFFNKEVKKLQREGVL